MIQLMEKLETIAVLLIMQVMLFKMGFMIQIQPYSEKVNLVKECLNMIVLLYLCYLMLLFTDFTEYQI
jgi:hypothetical protein